MNASNSIRVLLASATIAVVVAGAVLWSRGRSSADGEQGNDKPAVSIEQRIAILMDAAQAGDSAAYNACFIEPDTPTAPAALKQAHAKLTGYVIPEKSIVDDGHGATIVLEKLYPEYNERYRLRLRKFDGDWKIAAMTPVKKHAPKIKYGTPVVPKPKKDFQPLKNTDER